MTIFESIKPESIDELVELLDKYGAQDCSPWDEWFDRNYCKMCEPEIIKKENTDYYHDIECGWCELNDGKCKFFPNLDEAPWGKQVIKLWLESEVEDADLMEEDKDEKV